VRRTSNAGALLSIAAGVITTVVVQVATGGAGWHMLTPALAGLLAAVALWLISLVFDVR
jgi:hypothetical protein